MLAKIASISSRFMTVNKEKKVISTEFSDHECANHVVIGKTVRVIGKTKTVTFTESNRTYSKDMELLCVEFTSKETDWTLKIFND